MSDSIFISMSSVRYTYEGGEPVRLLCEAGRIIATDEEAAHAPRAKARPSFASMMGLKD